MKNTYKEKTLLYHVTFSLPYIENFLNNMIMVEIL